jgi:hypothetical protein
MMDKEISFSYTELNRIEVYCAKCGTAVFFDVKKTEGYGRFEQCPICSTALSDKFKASVAALSRFFRDADESGSKIQFRVKAP